MTAEGYWLMPAARYKVALDVHEETTPLYSIIRKEYIRRLDGIIKGNVGVPNRDDWWCPELQGYLRVFYDGMVRSNGSYTLPQEKREES